MFDNVLRSKIEYLSERIVVCEGRLVLGDLPELSVQTLDNVRRIYYPSNLAWVCKKRRKNIPILLPASYTAGIRFCPVVLELYTICLRLHIPKSLRWL